MAQAAAPAAPRRSRRPGGSGGSRCRCVLAPYAPQHARASARRSQGSISVQYMVHSVIFLTPHVPITVAWSVSCIHVTICPLPCPRWSRCKARLYFTMIITQGTLYINASHAPLRRTPWPRWSRCKAHLWSITDHATNTGTMCITACCVLPCAELPVHAGAAAGAAPPAERHRGRQGAGGGGVAGGGQAVQGQR